MTASQRETFWALVMLALGLFCGYHWGGAVQLGREMRRVELDRELDGYLRRAAP